ncbi:hypothetical protein DPM19_05650 [Actinomadura craniellae]|uniref:Uncharacterized protein n=2 Tax=Actinomadura craniellae TaxID=2231787 RepID=A0A365HB39_9ACTN|nr:hypothetical protein DPM19_05650 [Actinomadura craniellae]
MAASMALVVGVGAAAPAAALPPGGTGGPGEPAEPVEPVERPVVTEETKRLLVGTGGIVAPPGQLYDEPFPDAPTAGIRKVAASLQVKIKSVSTLVTVPAGLNVGATKISVRYSTPAGSQWVEQDYVNGTGNRFLHHYPAGDGVKRANGLGIRIQQGADVYFIPWEIPVEPLYDVTYGPLRFHELDFCDLVSTADPIIGFRRPGIGFTVVEADMDGSTADVPEFAGTVTEVGSSRGLITHEVGWLENDDPPWWLPLGNDFREPFFLDVLAKGPALLPGTSRRVTFQKTSQDEECTAFFAYDITYKLRTYPYL